MTILEYKRYRKKSMKGRKRSIFFKVRGGKKKLRKGSRKYVIAISSILFIAAMVFLSKVTYSFFTTSPAFKLGTVKIDKDEGLKGVDFKGERKFGKEGTLFTLDLDMVVKNFKKNPWVKDVMVRKVYPRKIVVVLKKRRPVAMVNLKNLYFLDEKGKPFKRVSRYDKKVYPVVTGFSKKYLRSGSGKENIRQAVMLSRLVKESKVRGNVSEINYRKKDGFSLILKDSGLRVKLGGRNVKNSFARLETYYGKIRKYQDRAGYVDLKYSGKIIVGEKKGK